MPRNRIIICLALLIACLPMLGFPRAWESFFQIATGLSIIGLSFWTTIDRKLAMKAKAQMRRERHTKMVPTETPSQTSISSSFSNNNTPSTPETANSFSSDSNI